MPEWPEMERYRELLTQRLAGVMITGTEVTREKSINVPLDTFAEELQGKTIWFVERRGKHLILHLDNGKRLLLHLMLGGLLYFGTEEERPARSVQVTLRFTNGNLYFIGLRLGYLHLMTVKEIEAKLGSLGPDPMDRRLSEEGFVGRFRGKRGSIKSTLMDQQVVSGIGNCYADEILFTAGIKPTVKVPELNGRQWACLYQAVHTVLGNAIAHGGYMEMPFSQEDKLTGGYNERCLVYDREGELCGSCGSIIVKTEIASRKSFYCPHCQEG